MPIDVPDLTALTVCWDKDGNVLGVYDDGGDPIVFKEKDPKKPRDLKLESGYITSKKPGDPGICFWWNGKLY